MLSLWQRLTAFKETSLPGSRTQLSCYDHIGVIRTEAQRSGRQRCARHCSSAQNNYVVPPRRPPICTADDNPQARPAPPHAVTTKREHFAAIRHAVTTLPTQLLLWHSLPCCQTCLAPWRDNRPASFPKHAIRITDDDPVTHHPASWSGMAAAALRCHTGGRNNSECRKALLHRSVRRPAVRYPRNRQRLLELSPFNK